MPVHFVYLDEFGHLGPFMARTAPKYNESPVFGLAGIILPEESVRPFATKILQLKGHIFKNEIDVLASRLRIGKSTAMKSLLQSRLQNIRILEAPALGF